MPRPDPVKLSGYRNIAKLVILRTLSEAKGTKNLAPVDGAQILRSRCELRMTSQELLINAFLGGIVLRPERVGSTFFS